MKWTESLVYTFRGGGGGGGGGGVCMLGSHGFCLDIQHGKIMMLN